MSSDQLQGYKKTLNSPYTGIKGWIDSRLPLIRMMEAEYLKFPVPTLMNVISGQHEIDLGEIWSIDNMAVNYFNQNYKLQNENNTVEKRVYFFHI